MDILSALVTRLQDRFKAQIGTGKVWAGGVGGPRFSTSITKCSTSLPASSLETSFQLSRSSLTPTSFFSLPCWNCTPASFSYWGPADPWTSQFSCILTYPFIPFSETLQ